MSTDQHPNTDPKTNRQETATSRVDSSPSGVVDAGAGSAPSNATDAHPPHDPHLSVHVPPKREGTHRTIETEPLGNKKPSLSSVTVEEKTTSSTKEQVRNIERTSDLQREIPRLLEQKRQTLQAQKTFFVTEHYDEWQDTFISAEENPLPADFFEVNPETLPPEFFANQREEETLDVRPEDAEFPDILDIGEVKTSEDAFHDTVILKVPDKS